MLKTVRIGVVGLGYVGLPLAVEFGKKFSTVGFDIKPERVQELARGRDSTREVSSRELREAKKLSYTSALADLRRCNVFIVTVPISRRSKSRVRASARCSRRATS
jgi:UDP-N-acetyl-D-galactosamine dehydrogenase